MDGNKNPVFVRLWWAYGDLHMRTGSSAKGVCALYHCQFTVPLMGPSATSVNAASNLWATSGCRIENVTEPGALSSVLLMTFTVTGSSSRPPAALATMVTS